MWAYSQSIGDEIDAVCSRIRHGSGDEEALKLIQKLAAHIVWIENELGRLHEGELHVS